jgi:hypothetical protein
MSDFPLLVLFPGLATAATVLAQATPPIETRRDLGADLARRNPTQAGCSSPIAP